MSESLTFIIDNQQVTEPTPADAMAFVDDISYELDPIAADESKTMEYFREAKHYKASLSYDGKSYPDMSYAVIKMYDPEAAAGELIPIYVFFCTNDWDVDYDFNPFNPANYPETYRAIMGQMVSESIQPSGGYIPDAEFSGRFEVVMTKDPDGEPEPTPTKSEPEAYPSIERSLDKIVDKMEGNTATEVFKEAVPSVERSLWKIADLFEPESKEDEDDEEDSKKDSNTLFVTVIEGTINVTYAELLDALTHKKPIDGYICMIYDYDQHVQSVDSQYRITYASVDDNDSVILRATTPPVLTTDTNRTITDYYYDIVVEVSTSDEVSSTSTKVYYSTSK